MLTAYGWLLLTLALVLVWSGGRHGRPLVVVAGVLLALAAATVFILSMNVTG